MTPNSGVPGDPLDWKYGEPETDDVFEVLERLDLPDTFEDGWHVRFRHWAMRMNVTLVAVRRAERDNKVHSRVVDEGIDRARGFFARAVRDAIGFLVQTKHMESAVYTADCLEIDPPEDAERTPRFTGDLNDLWKPLRERLVALLARIEKTAVQLEAVPPLAAVAREVRVLASIRSPAVPIPTVELLEQSRAQKVLVRINGRISELTPMGAWFLATCGLTGFENTCYRVGSINTLIRQLFEGQCRGKQELIVRRTKTECVCKAHYSCYRLDKALRSQISPSGGPKLEAVQKFLLARLDAKRGR